MIFEALNSLPDIAEARKGNNGMLLMANTIVRDVIFRYFKHVILSLFLSYGEFNCF